MLNYIIVIFSSCAAISASLNGVDPSINVTSSESLPIKNLECQLVTNGSNDLLCMADGSLKPDKKKKNKHFEDLKVYKLVKIDEDTYILSNETKSKVFQIHGDKIVLHERILTKDQTKERVCVGKVKIKK